MKWGVNMFIKKFFILVISLIIILSFCGCSKDDGVNLGVTCQEIHTAMKYNDREIIQGRKLIDEEKIDEIKIQYNAISMKNESILSNMNAFRMVLLVTDKNTTEKNYLDKKVRGIILVCPLSQNTRQSENTRKLFFDIVKKVNPSLNTDEKVNGVIYKVIDNMASNPNSLTKIGNQSAIMGETVFEKYKYILRTISGLQVWIITNKDDSIKYSYDEIITILNDVTSEIEKG